jgi:hypothetical protein
MPRSPLRPPVHPFVECPNCRQLLEFGAEVCSRCREPIDPEYAAVSAVIVHWNTQACSVANDIAHGDAFAPLALIGSVLIFATDWYISGRAIISLLLPLWPLVPLLMTAFWFLRYGRFKIGDDEFLKARRDMRNSFLFWLAILVVQLLAIAALSFRLV